MPLLDDQVPFTTHAMSVTTEVMGGEDDQQSDGRRLAPVPIQAARRRLIRPARSLKGGTDDDVVGQREAAMNTRSPACGGSEPMQSPSGQ